jgi:hypothetical protein
MVLMTVSTTIEELHNRAHAAASATGDSDSNWWDGSLETALAAAAGSLHPPGLNRAMGERALDGLLQWLDDDDARPIGEDAAALALGAFAAKRLRGGNKQLRKAALSYLDQVLHISNAPLAALHLTLIAWALRSIIPVNDSSPWPEIRERFPKLLTIGVDAQLVEYGRLLATKDPDPRELAPVLRDVPAKVDPSEYGILLWALWSGTELLARLTPDPNDSQLDVVRNVRQDIFEAVAAEIRCEATLVEAADEFNPFPDPDDTHQVAEPPDTFEMLMIDLALSPEIRKGEPLLTPTDIDIEVARRSARPLHLNMALSQLVAILATVLVVGAGIWAKARFGITFGAGTLTFALATLVTLRIWNRLKDSWWPRRALLDADISLLVLGAATIFTWIPKHPLVTKNEFITVAAPIIASGLVFLLSAFVRPWVEGRRGSE